MNYATLHFRVKSAHDALLSKKETQGRGKRRGVVAVECSEEKKEPFSQVYRTTRQSLVPKPRIAGVPLQ